MEYSLLPLCLRTLYAYHFYFSSSEKILCSLQESLSVLSPELIPIHERLVNIRRQLVALAAKETAAQAALKEYEESLALKQQRSIITPRQKPPPPPPVEQEDKGEEDLSKTPTKDTPNPEIPPVAPRLKAELKPLIEVLRSIDG